MNNSVVTVLDSETALLELQRPLCAVPFHLTEHLPIETTSFCKFCCVHSPQSTCLWQPLLSASSAVCTHHKAPVCGNHFFLQVLLCMLTTKHLSVATAFFLQELLHALATKHLPMETSSFCETPAYRNQFFLQVLPCAPTTKHLPMETFLQSTCLQRQVLLCALTTKHLSMEKRIIIKNEGCSVVFIK